MIASSASAWSLGFLRGLVERGITDLVVCPGSRSQSLALLSAALEDRGLLTVHVVLDERAAGFLALGIAIETGRPAPVVTTSGSSVANLHPAAVEAFHAGIPFLAVTADRPQSIRLTGATQTTVHVGTFAAATAATFDVPPFADADAAESDGARVAAEAIAAVHTGGGVVHVNPQFEEPLSSAVDADVLDSIEAGPWVPATRAAETIRVEAASGVLVVAGLGAGADAERWARELGAPLFAEVESGAHYGPHLVTDYRNLGPDPDFVAVLTTIVVVGRPTLARIIDVLCSKPGIDVIVVRRGEGVPYRPVPTARLVDAIEAIGDGDAVARAWGIPLARRSRAALDARTTDPVADVAGSLETDHAARAEFARREGAILREPVTPELLVRAIWDATWPHDRLVFGASSLIREADAVVPGKPLRVHSNRGLAGIDGTIATAAGIARAAVRTESDRAGATRIVLGDLAAAYDASSLALLGGSVQVFVGNNHGGRIFDDLPVAATADPIHFAKVMRTAQKVNFEGLAAAYGLGYRRVETRGELLEALGDLGRSVLVEVVLAD